MTLGKARLVPLVLFLPEFEWNVAVPYHVLDFVPAQEGCHEDEVKKEQWPVNFDVCRLEATAESCQDGG